MKKLIIAAFLIITFLLISLTEGCVLPEKVTCLTWCKEYLNINSYYYQTDERPPLPAIAVVDQGRHAVIIWGLDTTHYWFRDNGYMGYEGKILKSEVMYWIRRVP